MSGQAQEAEPVALGLGEPLRGDRGHHLLVRERQLGHQVFGKAGEGV